MSYESITYLETGAIVITLTVFRGDYRDKKICDAYEIFELLLQYGADPNQNTAQHPIKGYTPFMLAVEKDNAYAVDLMLKHGAQLDQSYVKADEGCRIFLNEIADFSNANQVKELISIS
ncbi:ankyrin repeat domain-containing protein [Acinetobacter ursingii]|uniref:ankyrin repeat domain-containing protein n=1 Tax=Acinetobacter ursingii TaxID=108980 RepID=UPI004033F9B3